MGAYNVVTVTMPCPACKSPRSTRIQFKFGDTWQHEYKVGDRLRWGGNDIGKPGYRRVVVDGFAEKCTSCGHEGPSSFYLFIEQDVIKAVEPASHLYDFARAHQSFIVLED